MIPLRLINYTSILYRFFTLLLEFIFGSPVRINEGVLTYYCPVFTVLFNRPVRVSTAEFQFSSVPDPGGGADAGLHRCVQYSLSVLDRMQAEVPTSHEALDV